MPQQQRLSAYADRLDSPVVEYLRIRVQDDMRKAWLKAERESWGPWLETKPGFLGRQLYWDKDGEEAIVLITWSSRSNWKSISLDELEKIQFQFEQAAREATGQLRGNPFPLTFEGELIPEL